MLLALRFLRLIWKGADILFVVLGIAATVFFWLTNGFWSGLGCFILCLLGFGLIVGGSTTIHRGRLKWDLECEKCGYNHVTIIHEEEYAVRYRCPRCGHEQVIGLMH